MSGDNVFVPARCLRFDGSPADDACFSALASFFAASDGQWGVYGDTHFIVQLSKHIPSDAANIVLIKDPARHLQERAALPKRIFVCSVRCEQMIRYVQAIQSVAPQTEIYTIHILEQIAPHSIPPEAYQPVITSIYPMPIPEIRLNDGLDFLLLDLPASYSMLRVGFGYVHEILKRQGIHHQTLDLNMILYHRFHMHRIMDRPEKLQTLQGYEMPEDPWGPLVIDEWCLPEMIEYFRSDIEELLFEIERARPAILGISLQMGNRLLAQQVVKGVRQISPGTVIVVGGFDCVHKEFGPKVFTDFDYMVIGEAELTLPPLVNCLVRGERPKDLPGIISKSDSQDRTWQTPPLVENLDELPFPTYDWAGLALYRYYYGGFIAEIAINRGCKWSRCTFCTECFPWRKRSATNVVDEIQWFASQGCQTFNFSVSDAIGDSVTLLGIAQEIIRRDLAVNINTQLRIDKRSNLEFFKTLFNAGFKHLAFGVDGWSDHVLRLQNKGYNIALVKQNLKDAHLAGISVSVNIVLGVPGERDEDVVEAVENIISLRGCIDSFNSIYPLLLAAGSRYYDNPSEYSIRFVGEQADIYEKHPYRIPANLWYSEAPYIDQSVRLARIAHLCDNLNKNQIKIDHHVLYMVNKIFEEFNKAHASVADKEDSKVMKPELEQPEVLLSILCQGRNDSYMGNFNWRLSTVLNKLAENVTMLGLENRVEILVSDWGSETPLHTVLELTETARRLVKYLLVPQDIASRYDQDAGFSVPHAINAIARRARGKYVMFSDSDVYIPMETMAKLMHYLGLGYFHSFDLRNSFFWASKYHIPNDFIADSPYREHVEDHIQRNWTSYMHETVNTEEFMGSGVCLLMSRAMWFESTGWDERLIYMGWNDIDFTRRLLFKYRWDDLENHGMTFFHLEHYRDRFNPEYASENKKRLNPYVEPTIIAPNPPNWGLADHDLGFIDGYGLPIQGNSHSGQYSCFDLQKPLRTVQDIVTTNPLYQGVDRRFDFEPHSWFTNAEAVNALLEVLQPQSVCEIGSWMGASARCFAACSSVNFVACVDHWDRNRVEKYKPGLHPEHLMNNMYEQFLANAVHSGTDGKICPIRLDSDSAVTYCTEMNIGFDLIYVDGDHTTVGAHADILKWHQLLNDGGYMCGDDWSWQKEPDNVAGAVVSAAREKVWQVFYHGNFWLVIPGNFSVQPLTLGVLQEIKPISRIETPKQSSELDIIIAPEIKNDEFYNLIIELASTEKISTILEIGSSAGGGSTEAFVTAVEKNPSKPRLYCMEVSQPRFNQLKQRYADKEFVQCYNTSSVSLSRFPSSSEVESFYCSHRTNLNSYPLPQVLGWLNQDIEYVQHSGLNEDGIKRIRQENRIDHFDMVLIDGSEFTGKPELDEVYGARWLLLDDINVYKNFENYQRLKNDPNYGLYRENWQLRHGYAIFKKKAPELPIHFFTIVLNGMPFIRHHIETLQQLPFSWHWHIVEGVAELKHDTAWSVALGGQVTDELHHNGLSNDGTSAYLDELARENPGKVTLYRKPVGQFWDGKVEMVQAPLSAISEECLLWQVDVDEFWTPRQISAAREMFLSDPDKTAAFYWCWFFVGPDKVVSSRNCYSQNPLQEWLRTWKFTPGMSWIAHEPPCLAITNMDGIAKDVARINPFTHSETEQAGLVFQHFAYALREQLLFKETYYGYRDAVCGWMQLQQQQTFPIRLREFFSWVQDETMVDTTTTCGITPLITFAENTPPRQSIALRERKVPRILIDGIFFQFASTGIARVWTALLREWAQQDFAGNILVLDRANSAPRIEGLSYRTISPYDYSDTDSDRRMLQIICDEEQADLFVSTYYTTPQTTPSVFYAHDMIPEKTPFFDLNHPMWREKHYGLNHASAFIAVTHNTAIDLIQFHPPAFGKTTVALNGLDHSAFKPASHEELIVFIEKYSISKPYFLLVGAREAYKNAALFFTGFAKLADHDRYDIICCGGEPVLEPGFAELAAPAKVHLLRLNDSELRAAYSLANALVYPSVYEGFGLPILEAMACGCPVITCQNSSLPEVAAGAALYVSHDSPEQMTNALKSIVDSDVRTRYIQLGINQASKFTWDKTADLVKNILLTTYQSLST